MRIKSITFAIIILCGGTSLVYPIEIGLITAIQTSIERSPEIAKARLAVEEAKLSEPLLMSELDTSIEANYLKSEDESPRVAPAFEGLRSETENFGVSLVQKTLLGTDARLVWDNQKIENAALFRVLDPSVESTLTLRIRQPLLRYFWGRPDIARRRRFRTAVLAEEAQLRATTERVAHHSAQMYLNVIYAKERVRIGELAVTEAKRLLESYSGKKRYGLIEESDLLQARASLEAVEADLELAKSDLKKANASLEEILREGDVQVVFDDMTLRLPFDSKKQAMETAETHRGDLLAAKHRKESSEWAHRSQKLDTLPDLAFVGSYGGAGLGGTYNKAWDDLDGFDSIVKSAGVNLTVPFGFKKEALLRRSTKIQMNRAEQTLVETEDRVRREVDEAWTQFELQKTRLIAREKLLKLQTQKLKAESTEFARGRSSTDILVRFQQDMFQAELDFARTKNETLLSQMELGAATGILMDILNLDKHP